MKILDVIRVNAEAENAKVLHFRNKITVKVWFQKSKVCMISLF